MKNVNYLGSEHEKEKDQNKLGNEQEQNYYGRSRYESVPFNQTNFESLQNLLNKRNELLSTVKSTNLFL